MLVHQASCLNLVTNTLIVWNTVYVAAVVDIMSMRFAATESPVEHQLSADGHT